jgi:hypothetical protein
MLWWRSYARTDVYLTPKWFSDLLLETSPKSSPEIRRGLQCEIRKPLYIRMEFMPEISPMQVFLCRAWKPESRNKEVEYDNKKEGFGRFISFGI